MDGEKAKVAITHDVNKARYNYPLTEAANKWVLDKILNVDKVVVQSWYVPEQDGCKVGYSCVKNSKVVCQIVFDENTLMEDRIAAMQVSLRMTDGNNSQKQKSSTSSP